MKELSDMKELIKKIKKARFVFVCGNGGSAANAEHLTNDLFSKGIKAICLSSNVSIMTMIGNDYGYHMVFCQQIDHYADKFDMLITISCSGDSPNIFNAINTAESIGMATYQFEAFKDFDSTISYEALENRHQELIHRIKDAL